MPMPPIHWKKKFFWGGKQENGKCCGREKGTRAIGQNRRTDLFQGKGGGDKKKRTTGVTKSKEKKFEKKRGETREHKKSSLSRNRKRKKKKPR